MHRILHYDAEQRPDIRKLSRYFLQAVVEIHKTTVEPLKVDLNTKFLNLYEVQDILKEELGPMVYSTVLRKAAKGEIPALKFGDIYRVSEEVLYKFIKNGNINYRSRRH